MYELTYLSTFYYVYQLEEKFAQSSNCIYICSQIAAYELSQRCISGNIRPDPPGHIEFDSGGGDDPECHCRAF